MYEVWIIDNKGAYLHSRTDDCRKAAKAYTNLANLWPEFLVSISRKEGCESKLLAI